jgi:hypothetical protein
MSRRIKIVATGVIVLASALFLGRSLIRGPEAPGLGALQRVAEQDEITPLPSPTDLPPTPTETLLPEPELPTPESNLPVLEIWTGAPSYAAESEPGYDFRLFYDGSLWALTVDEVGLPALVNRDIPYCMVTPAAGRGLPRGAVSESQFRTIGRFPFEVVTVTQNGEVKFVNYFGGDTVVLTGFQVSFQEQREECLQAVENLLQTISSVLAPTPTLTPSPSPTETPTPSITP